MTVKNTSGLPEWITRPREWPKMPHRACGIGCDMGAAGPGRDGDHDPDCMVVKFVEALTIAIEALGNAHRHDNLAVRCGICETLTRIASLGDVSKFGAGRKKYYETGDDDSHLQHPNQISYEVSVGEAKEIP